MTAVIKELTVDYNSFKRALGDARRFIREGGVAGGGSTTSTQGCDPRKLEQIRALLRAFLEGKEVDICAVWRDLACCCAGGKHQDGCDDMDRVPRSRDLFLPLADEGRLHSRLSPVVRRPVWSDPVLTIPGGRFCSSSSRSS
jgi:hypothetical protein